MRGLQGGRQRSDHTGKYTVLRVLNFTSKGNEKLLMHFQWGSDYIYVHAHTFFFFFKVFGWCVENEEWIERERKCRPKTKGVSLGGR